MTQWTLIVVLVVYVAGVIACRAALHVLIPEDPEYVDNEILDAMKTASSMIWPMFALMYLAYLGLRLVKGIKPRLSPKKTG